MKNLMNELSYEITINDNNLNIDLYYFGMWTAENGKNYSLYTCYNETYFENGYYSLFDFSHKKAGKSERKEKNGINIF